MPAKKKINNESKPTEINVNNDMRRCKQVEEKLNECINISDEDESNESNESNESSESNETKQLTSTSKTDNKNKYYNIIYSPDTYVLKFGKYKGMKTKDIKKLEGKKMNKKSGETFMYNVRKHYLEFLLTLQWLCKSDKSYS